MIALSLRETGHRPLNTFRDKSALDRMHPFCVAAEITPGVVALSCMGRDSPWHVLGGTFILGSAHVLLSALPRTNTIIWTPLPH